MSLSSTLRQAGINALLVANGEGLTLSGSSVKAIVNRMPLKTRDSLQVHNGKLDFTLKGISEIEFVRTIAKPKVGHVFYDFLGLGHRVAMVCSSDITWVVYCTVFDPPAPIPVLSGVQDAGGGLVQDAGGGYIE
jgi:hypothetical protein